ncbi:MAG TPA: TonB family protein [Candidatus Acidoferrum sp.]|nr:TonB family protein [Candidatus Acidoferrum sp.]
MSPTAKDLETNNSQSTARNASSGNVEEANKPQPVPLEVPVTVNGARAVEGSDKREPFSESTQTVLVFHNGAVIRLSSSVTAGQLLFLTNDKTKKEVVCQVVKSKNYRNVSGYVELEFTEAVAGFWGMRFPGERATAPAPVAAAPARPAASVAPVTPIATVAPVTPRIDVPAATNVAPRVEPKPVAPAPRPAATVAPVIPAAQTAQPVTPAVSSPIFVARPETQHAPATHAENKPLPKAPGLTDGWGSGMTSSAPTAAHPQAPTVIQSPAPKAPVSNVAPPSQQVSANTHTTPDALRRESEKLQEQLATILGDEAKNAPVASIAPAAPVHPVNKVLEFSRPQSQTTKSIAPVKSAPLTPSDQDEVKIPSWLEPLARNAATHSQNELTARDESRNDRDLEFEVQDLSVPAASTSKEQLRADEAEPIFETHLVDGQLDLAAHAPKKSNKAILIGAVAAGLVLAAVGGTWYSRNSSGASSQNSLATAEAAPAPTAAAAEVAAANTNANASQPATRPVEKTTPNRSNINSEPVPQTQSAAASQQNAQNGQPSAQPAKSVSAELSAYKKLAEPVASAAPTKRPGLGEVHLGAPKATRAAGEVVGEAEALALNSSGQIIPGGDAMGGGLVAGNSKQPVAPAVPLPVGGDVKQARLLSSIPPVYPQLARAQHIAGAVLIDALIDANGRVSAMKVVSGPVLLHQSAMEALRQWKYQAATLDGKTVPMHLTVTIQFRLQ